MSRKSKSGEHFQGKVERVGERTTGRGEVGMPHDQWGTRCNITVRRSGRLQLLGSDQTGGSMTTLVPTERGEAAGLDLRHN